MAKFLKGQDVKLLVKDNSGNTTLLTKETSCSLSFTANTMDAASKADASPIWDNPEFDNVELTAQVGGNVDDYMSLAKLVGIAVGTEGHSYLLGAVLGTEEDNLEPRVSTIILGSEDTCPITSLEIDMPAEGLATVSVTIDCGSDFDIKY